MEPCHALLQVHHSCTSRATPLKQKWGPVLSFQNFARDHQNAWIKQSNDNNSAFGNFEDVTPLFFFMSEDLGVPVEQLLLLFMRITSPSLSAQGHDHTD